MRSREGKFLARAFTFAGGTILAAGAGLVALHSQFTRPVERLSYDLPFITRTTLATSEVVLVYLDDRSAKELQQPLGDVWNRALHTQLLERLTQDGARLVFYDIVFDAPAADPAADEEFSRVIARHGRVVLGAALDMDQPIDGVTQERILPPTRPLRRAAAAWGLLAFRPVDADYAVRQLFTGTSEQPNATWRAAELLGGRVVDAPREGAAQRWINYYGPPDTFSSVSFIQALSPDGVRPGYFKDRIVLVGGRSVVSYLGLGRDEFATPYSLAGHRFSTGLEVHAHILLNLLRGEWLTRLPLRTETMLVLLFGVLVGLLVWLRPLWATAVTIAVAVALTGGAFWSVWNERVWWNWLVPVAIQLPAGLLWSLGARYYVEARRRKELRRAFGFYLSPEMAEKISNSDFDLTPGGKLVEATIMFTDLQGFTTMSEDLNPTEVSQTLIAYFERTTRCILERKGTIVKYVGDAVMAGWGAPLEQPNHALLAAEAACDLLCLTDIEMRGHRLRTRIGVNTGPVLAGNLGSSYRFDYTMIGDTTNFASRLEALNKYLGTQLLISEATRVQLGDRFLVRPLGEFRTAGKAHSVVIHELICRCDDEAGERQWIDLFAEALAQIRTGDIAGARQSLQWTQDLRAGTDGPAIFYLKTIAELEQTGRLSGWSGVVEMAEK